MTAAGSPDTTLTIVVPVFNEAAALPGFIVRLRDVLGSVDAAWRIVFVDDGSVDATPSLLRQASDADGRIAALVLSRNFGKETAIAAGLGHAAGDAVILMDGDGQHPPEVIPEFLAQWRADYKVVFGKRQDTQANKGLRGLYSAGFHYVFGLLADRSLPRGAVDFLLLDRQAVDAMNQLRERTRFSKGLYSWIGYRSTTVPFICGERVGGTSKWRLRGLARFAIDGITSFSSVPLKIWSYFGFAISAAALVYSLYFLLETLVFGIDVPGFPSLIVSIMFFSGVQLITLGVIGEYIARIYDEVKGRPLFLVAEKIGQFPTREPPPP